MLLRVGTLRSGGESTWGNLLGLLFSCPHRRPVRICCSRAQLWSACYGASHELRMPREGVSLGLCHGVNSNEGYIHMFDWKDCLEFWKTWDSEPEWAVTWEKQEKLSPSCFLTADNLSWVHFELFLPTPPPPFAFTWTKAWMGKALCGLAEPGGKKDGGLGWQGHRSLSHRFLNPLLLLIWKKPGRKFYVM